MKVTEPRLNTLIDNLNTLICEDSLLTRKERETLVLAVAAIGAMKARRHEKARDTGIVETAKRNRHLYLTHAFRMPAGLGG
jgi:hypothetical protein